MSFNSDREKKRFRVNNDSLSSQCSNASSQNDFTNMFLEALFEGANSGENLIGTGTLPTGLSSTDPESIINEIIDSISNFTENCNIPQKRKYPVTEIETKTQNTASIESLTQSTNITQSSSSRVVIIGNVHLSEERQEAEATGLIPTIIEELTIKTNNPQSYSRIGTIDTVDVPDEIMDTELYDGELDNDELDNNELTQLEILESLQINSGYDSTLMDENEIHFESSNPLATPNLSDYLTEGDFEEEIDEENDSTGEDTTRAKEIMDRIIEAEEVTGNEYIPEQNSSAETLEEYKIEPESLEQMILEVDQLEKEYLERQSLVQTGDEEPKEIDDSDNATDYDDQEESNVEESEEEIYELIDSSDDESNDADTDVQDSSSTVDDKDVDASNVDAEGSNKNSIIDSSTSDSSVDSYIGGSDKNSKDNSSDNDINNFASDSESDIFYEEGNTSANAPAPSTSTGSIIHTSPSAPPVYIGHTPQPAAPPVANTLSAQELSNTTFQLFYNEVISNDFVFPRVVKVVENKAMADHGEVNGSEDMLENEDITENNATEKDGSSVAYQGIGVEDIVYNSTTENLDAEIENMETMEDNQATVENMLTFEISDDNPSGDGDQYLDIPEAEQTQIAYQLESLPSFHADTQIIPETWQDEELRLATHNVIQSAKEMNRFKVDISDIIGDENGLRMWWYDAYEEYKKSISLFGKVYDQTHNKYVSCCIIVENIQREIYVLPRKYKHDDNDEITKEKVTLGDVMLELEDIIRSKGITNWQMEVCTRKYAFELPDIPPEAQYIKLNYSFYDYRFPTGFSGHTFSHMFGNTVDILEQFIIQKNIMGPCWLEFENVFNTNGKQSWCAVEGVIQSPQNCSVVKDELKKPMVDGPPLTIMSLSLQVKMNHSTQSNEILAASGFVCLNVNINDQETATSYPSERFSITRRLPEVKYPRETRLQVNQERDKTNLKISLENTEETLLCCLLSHIQLFDPDIIVGHNFLGIDLDILLHRMRQFKTLSWSRLGRRRIDSMPKLQSGAGGSGTSSFYERLVMSGRLVCDTYAASKDLVRSKLYHLTELACSQLNIQREDMTPGKIKEYGEAGTLDLELARHGSFDAYLSFALMVKLQILPLTKRLTNLSGNLWSRSMNGARSERNEYLLLHTFYNKGYVCPDKPNPKKKNMEVLFASEDLELEQSTKKRNGSNAPANSYLGGLVLEPKSGFYDKYILLLDFNSLYPSIMQEYNVCFTTMEREHEGSANYNALNIPKTPSPDIPQGILPSLVKMFVQRRQSVKKLMKNSNLSKSAKVQCDIEQMALKLTANSMYGCLGSPISRFYARSLAMYITSKGREILKSTVELAESKKLDVVYGDTDSIMISTSETKMYRAKAIGEKLKKEVNRMYKVLEIDIDGFFRHTLLLRKKKYAALLVKEKPNGGLQESVEVKGLDLVRRDWCNLSHKVSEHVLSFILSDNDREEVVNNIHDYLKETAMKTNNLEFNLENFIIQKQLTKAPEEYKQSKSQPHVQVAKDMRRAGKTVKAGDTIPYVMCKSGDANNVDIDAFTEPRMPDDVRDGKAHLDIEWYLHKQILPPVNRLCSPIDGTSLSTLASCLGLDKEQIAERIRLPDEAGEINEDGKAIGPKSRLLNDEERYTNIEPLILRCSACHFKNEYTGKIADNDQAISRFMCKSCQQHINPTSIYAQISQIIRDDVTKYYSSQFMCDQCEFSTRFISTIDGHLCRNNMCNGYLLREFSDKMLYDRLNYLSVLFEFVSNNDQLIPVRSLIDNYINMSGYKYINMSSIFEDVDI